MKINSLSALKKSLVAGSVFTCLAHHRQPKLVGSIRTVTKAQGNGIFYTCSSHPGGQRLWLEWPKASQMVFTDDGFEINYWEGEPSLKYRLEPKQLCDSLPLEQCAEYDAAADWCARRGLKGNIGDPLPANMASDGALKFIQADPEAFQIRVRETAYALACEKTSP